VTLVVARWHLAATNTGGRPAASAGPTGSPGEGRRARRRAPARVDSGTGAAGTGPGPGAGPVPVLRPDSRFTGNWGPAPPRFRLETHWLRVCTRHHYYANGMATDTELASGTY
jgi:hypothetical protein